MPSISAIKHFLKNHTHIISVCFLLLFFFTIYIQKIDYPIVNEADGASNYLVANHIVSFREFPLVGPYNSGTLDTIKYSPLYYYFLAFFLLFHNSFYTLGVVNVFILLATLLFIYLIAYCAFGKVPAFIAILLLGISPFFQSLAVYIWQPHAMMPFVYLSYLFLLLSYIKKRFRYLIFSGIAMSVAITFHFAALGIIPFFLVVAAVASRVHKQSFKKFCIFFIVFLASVVALHTPSLLYSLTSPQAYGMSLESIQYANVLSYLYNNVTTILSFLSLDIKYSLFPFTAFVAIATLVISFVMYFKRHHLSYKSVVLICMTITIFSDITISSFTRNNFTIYLLPAMGLFPIVVGEVITNAWRVTPALRMVTVVIVIQLVILSLLRPPLQSVSPYRYQQAISSATDAITHTIIEKKLPGITLYNFQTASIYARIQFEAGRTPRFSSYISQAAMLAPLEVKLQQKLTRLFDGGSLFEQTNKHEYIFVTCFTNHRYPAESHKVCINLFRELYLGFGLLKKIYRDNELTVYVASSTSPTQAQHTSVLLKQ